MRVTVNSSVLFLGLCFSIVYAALLTKTNRIYRIFRSGANFRQTWNKAKIIRVLIPRASAILLMWETVQLGGGTLLLLNIPCILTTFTEHGRSPVHHQDPVHQPPVPAGHLWYSGHDPGVVIVNPGPISPCCYIYVTILGVDKPRLADNISARGHHSPPHQGGQSSRLSGRISHTSHPDTRHRHKVRVHCH